MKRKISFLLSIFVILSLFLIPLSLLLAQDTKAGLELSPISYEVEAEPGESFSKEIRLTNVSDKKISVAVSTEDFIAGGEKGEPKILVGEEEGASKWSLRHWVKFEEESFELEKGEKKIFYFDVNIPSDAEPGGHYGIVRFTSSISEIGEGGVAISGSVGCLVLLKVKGDVTETGKIVDFYSTRTSDSEVKKSSFFEKGPVGFELRFENTGTVHYKPKGTIEITSLFGKKTSLAIDERNVLPESIRKFDTQWENAPFIGRFTAQAEMTYGSQNTSSQSEKIVFYIIPWKIVLAALVVLIILIILIWRQIKLSKKIKKIEKEENKKIIK